jgi:hypothetical protein
VLIGLHRLAASFSVCRNRDGTATPGLVDVIGGVPLLSINGRALATGVGWFSSDKPASRVSALLPALRAIDGGSQMTSTAGREHEQDRRSLAAAYKDAAAAHDQAARMHEKIADHYDTHHKSARAMRERRMAAQERRSAVADRKWIATLAVEEPGNLKSSSDKPDKPESYGADLAALLGATIAVLLTLTGSPGAWGPLSTIIGLLLLVVLLAFFWGRRPVPRPWTWEGRRRKLKLLFRRTNLRQLFSTKGKRRPAREKWQSFLVGFALSIVIGLVGAIASAQAVQWRWFRDDTGYMYCRSVAAAQATKAVRDLSDTYASAKALRSLANTALVSGSTERTESSALGDAFYHTYDDAVGDCRAGDTFQSLWWVGVPSFLLAFFWWNWKYIKSPVNRKKRRSALTTAPPIGTSSSSSMRVSPTAP